MATQSTVRAPLRSPLSAPIKAVFGVLAVTTMKAGVMQVDGVDMELDGVAMTFNFAIDE